MSQIPDGFRELHRKLGSVRFSPRASFGPELLGRVRRGDEPRRHGSPMGSRRNLMAAAVAIISVGAAVGMAGLVPSLWRDAVTIDRCCYDLDGGGEPDDGVLVLAERDDRVHRLRIYEDLDGSRSFTAGDLVRFDRGGTPAILPGGEPVITTKRCCVDFDGGGPDDDGVLLIGVPPDRILMAAIYETGAKADARTSAGWLLR